ncbi:restriction endonuclease subunit S [Cellulosimicrobium arenosum]|uniref:Restriction endonuclease subunit S n=1 Tax=Cellulosimicrobium arenosum TaxID=2708133 RepID=A0A927G7K0_9MICO|nr:restriction endonuclease subunit S [Cellulosimicrobium arenosum]MBD8078170.1 restriction endonuclease subunit S [Cellulosimicrobium arenosum]
MAEWRTATLRELVSLQRGQSYKSAFLDEPGPWLLGLGTIGRNGGFRGENLRTYGGPTAANILLGPGDLYVSLKDVTHAADLLGAVAMVPVELGSARLTQDTIRLDVDDALVDQRYLYWLLRSPAYRAHCKALGTGTTNLDLSRDDFLRFPFRLPSRTGQEAIADVLGALDEKIAANTRLATTADDLASSIFMRAVHGLEFSAQTFADVARVGGGGTPKSAVSEYWVGDVLWLTPTDVTALPGPYISSTKRTISEAGLQSISSALYDPGAIFMTSRATIGAFALAEAPMAVNQGFIVVEPLDESLRYWLFHEMRSRVGEFLDHANGATFMELSRGNFKKLPVRLAAPEVMTRFNETARVLHARASAALTENRALTAMRDALLPQLMSGRLRVRDAVDAIESGSLPESVSTSEPGAMTPTPAATPTTVEGSTLR